MRATSTAFLRVITLLAFIAGSWTAIPDGMCQNQIKIGVLEPLSGPIAAEGRRQLNGMELARELINERGGIAGKQLTWVVADAPDATAAANEATRLISQEAVRLIADHGGCQ